MRAHRMRNSQQRIARGALRRTYIIASKEYGVKSREATERCASLGDNRKSKGAQVGAPDCLVVV